MQGTVYIYSVDNGERELLYTDDNMTVDGFAEQIVDLLTLPSAIGSVTSPATTANFLDTSNYTIQAVSMSKAKEHFQQNQHAYTTENLLYFSDLSNFASGVSPTSSNPWYLRGGTLETNAIQGPEFGVSGHRLVRELGDPADLLTYEIGFSSVDGNNALNNGNYSIPAYGNNDGSGFYFSGTDFTFSIDLKVDEDYLPDVDDESRRLTEIKITNLSSTLVSSLVVEWDSSGNASLFQSFVEAGITDGRQAHGAIKSLGGGWYRTFLNSKCDLSSPITALGGAGYPLHLSSLQVTISPTVSTDELADQDDATDTAGAIYFSRPQLELGRVPTNYVVNTTSGTLSDLSRFSNLNEAAYIGQYVTGVARYDYYFTSGPGLSFSGIYGGTANHVGLSAYIPDKTPMPPAAHPHDRVLTKDARTPVEEALGIEFIKGQNPAAIGLSGTLMLSSFTDDWTYTSAYTPNIGRHVAYLGAFHPAGNAFAFGTFVTALDEAGMANPLSSIYLRGSFETQPDVDRYGYIRAKDNGIQQYAGPAGVSRSRFQMSAASDFSSTGEVVYTTYLQSNTGTSIGTDTRDPLGLNLFGGVSILGLWGIDLKATREANQHAFPPYNNDFDDILVEPERRYKLMSKKVLTDNIVRNEGSAATSRAGWEYNSNLEVKWVLKFI